MKFNMESSQSCTAPVKDSAGIYFFKSEDNAGASKDKAGIYMIPSPAKRVEKESTPKSAGAERR